eukprot:426809-Pleurochrysis_carterae.AAC.3
MQAARIACGFSGRRRRGGCVRRGRRLPRDEAAQDGADGGDETGWRGAVNGMAAALRKVAAALKKVAAALNGMKAGLKGWARC